MEGTVVLIGPMNAGKTTQAGLLAEALGRPRVELDLVRWDYYDEIGYDRDHAARLRESGGFEAVYRYWKPFEAHGAIRVVEDHPESVIAFGAGHSVFEDPALLARVRAGLARVPHVVLLLPCPDPETSLRILGERGEPDGAMNRHFLTHPSNAALATHTVYTSGRPPEAARDEILGIVTAPCP